MELCSLSAETERNEWMASCAKTTGFHIVDRSHGIARSENNKHSATSLHVYLTDCGGGCFDSDFPIQSASETTNEFQLYTMTDMAILPMQ